MAICGGDKVALPTPPPGGPCPWLVYNPGKGYRKQTFCCDISGPNTYSIPALCHKKIVSCSYGWQVLYDEDTKLLSLCKYSTTFDVAIILPSLHHLSNYKIESCVLLPNNNNNNNNTSCRLDDFKVLVFLEKIPSIMCYCVGSDCEEWIELRYWEQVETLLTTLLKNSVRHNGPLFFSRTVTCGGKIYAQLGFDLSVDYYDIWSIEIVEEEKEPVGLVLSKLDAPVWRLWQRRTDVYLLESRGELFLLYFMGGNVVFELYRLNFVSMVFERVEKVEDRAFFIGESYCLSYPALGSGVIYFIKSNSLYCYYICDDSVLLLLPHASLPMLWLSSPAWIMPQVVVRLEDDHCTKDNSNRQGRNSPSTRSNLDLDENREEAQLCTLPLDVLELVSKRLIAVDYMNFRAVSRICRSVAPPVDWRRAIFKAETNFPFPLLMLLDRDQNLWKFMDPRNHNSSNNYYMMKIPGCIRKRNGPDVIRYSYNGWLLLSGIVSLLLYNPFTRRIITYRLDLKEFHNSLFFLPKPYNHTLISVAFGHNCEVFVSTMDVGDEDWFDHTLQSNRVFKGATHTSPVLFKDAFYYIDQKDGYLGKLKIDLPEGTPSWQVLDKPRPPACIYKNNSFHQNFLVECGGELISVFVGPVGKTVAVYILNGNDQAWETVTDLGNYDLYLSSSSSFSVLTSCGGNRMYFPLLRGSEIVYFSLETGKWHLSGSQDELSCFYGMRMHFNSCWIKPSW